MDEPVGLPVGFQADLRLFERDAPAHQLATNRDRFLFQVVDGRRRADPPCLAAYREKCILKELSGANLADPDLRDDITRQPAHRTVRDRSHRSRHQHPLPMGCNREFAEGFHRRPNGQAAVLSDFEIAHPVHERSGGKQIAPLIVKVDCRLDRMGCQIHEDQFGRDAGSVGEMCKDQSLLALSGSCGGVADGGERGEQKGERAQPSLAWQPLSGRCVGRPRLCCWRVTGYPVAARHIHRASKLACRLLQQSIMQKCLEICYCMCLLRSSPERGLCRRQMMCLRSASPIMGSRVESNTPVGLGGTACFRIVFGLRGSERTGRVAGGPRMSRIGALSLPTTCCIISAVPDRLIAGSRYATAFRDSDALETPPRSRTGSHG